MLPYAGTPRPFTLEEQRNAYLRDLGRSSSSVRRSVDLPHPLEPHPIQRSHDPFAVNSGARHREPIVVDAACINKYSFSEQTLPSLREVLMPSSRTSRQAVEFDLAYKTPPPCEQRCDGVAYGCFPSFHDPIDLHLAHPLPRPFGIYAAQHDRPSGFSTVSLATRPVTRRTRPLLSIPPHHTYHKDENDQAEMPINVPRQTSMSSEMTSLAIPVTDSGLAHKRFPTLIELPTASRLTRNRPKARKYLGIMKHPRESTFHVYEDGYRIPTHVNGETVNPNWGLTKANKPRKRSALACLDCREKKIKCEPGATECSQCEKVERLYRWYVAFFFGVWYLALTMPRAPRRPVSHGRQAFLRRVNASGSPAHACQMDYFPDTRLQSSPISTSNK